MSIELPKDAEGREIPLDTEVLYDRCGTKVSVKEFLSTTSVDNQRTGWTIKAAYEGKIDYNSFRPKDIGWPMATSTAPTADGMDRSGNISALGTCWRMRPSIARSAGR